MSEGSEKSIGWVITMVMILIGVVGWCFLASFYIIDGEATSSIEVAPRRPSGFASAGVVQFLLNGVTQLPNIVSVLTYGFTKKLWLLITVGVLEVLAIISGRQMKKLENAVDSTRRR